MPFDPIKPVQLRNGKPVTIYTTLARGTRPIHGTYETENKKENWEAYSWLANGRMYTDSESPWDLINIPVKVTRYLNVYRSDGLLEPYFGGGKFYKEAAQAKEVLQDKQYLTTVKIEFEDPAGEPATPAHTTLVSEAQRKAKREALQWALDHFRKQFPVSDAYVDYESELIRELEGR